MPTFTVTEERAIRAPADQIWAVIADPEKSSSLQPRATLLSHDGDAGAEGSTFTFEVCDRRDRPHEWRYVVTRSEPYTRLVTQASVRGRHLAEQEALVSTVGAVSRLRWRVTISCPFGTAWAIRPTVERELRSWLGLVVKAAEKPG